MKTLYLTNTEIFKYCNQILTELVEKQFSNPLLEIEDQTMTGEF
ncbi:hypothetical protein [Nostoc sp. LPT]|nr:hypothetical protein [Nostoc sp. LPT]